MEELPVLAHLLEHAIIPYFLCVDPGDVDIEKFKEHKCTMAELKNELINLLNN